MNMQDPAGVAESNAEATDERRASFAWNADIEDLMAEWRLRAWVAQMAHYRVASRLRRSNVGSGCQ